MTYKIANRIAVAKRMRATAKRVVDALSKELQKDIKANLNRGASNGANKPGPAGGFPYKNTGTLGRSIQIAYGNDTRATITNRVGTNLKYARVHEFGGIITARGRALTIPLNHEAKMLRQRTPGSLRGVDGLWLWKPHKGYGGPGFLVKSISKRGVGSLKLMFVLRKSVRIPARPYMRPTLRAFIPKAHGIAMRAIAPRGGP